MQTYEEYLEAEYEREFYEELYEEQAREEYYMALESVKSYMLDENIPFAILDIAYEDAPFKPYFYKTEDFLLEIGNITCDNGLMFLENNGITVNEKSLADYKPEKTINNEDFIR